MTQIIPAILPNNQGELSEKVGQVLGLVTHVQVDVCDGMFVPSVTDFGMLPHLDRLEYELDLMIDRPEKKIGSFIDMQPTRIIVHLESVGDFQVLFRELARARGIIEVGLSVSNDTDESLLEAHVGSADFVQFMGIARIGFQGEPFDERVIGRIRTFHAGHPEVPISVDGAVGPQTIRKLSDAGATRFVSGSAIFSGDPEKNLQEMENMLG